ncbi:MAG: hypothetical protein ACFFCX_17880, partial [Candidatus Sifarchaeia archaeon]
ARANVFLALFERSYGSPQKSQKKMKSLQKFIYYLQSLFNIRFNPFFCGKKDILFSGGQRRVLNKDNLWWDIHVDPLLEDLEMSYVSLEYPVGMDHRSPAKTPHLKHYDVIDTLGVIRKLLGFSKVRLNQKDHALLEKIRNKFKEVFGVQVDVKAITMARIKERDEHLPLCVKLLKQIQPKIVVIVTSYAREPLIEACKLLTIPVVELQHGVITPYHPGYSFPKSARKKIRFPDYLFVFGEHWKHHIDYPISNERIFATGFPFLENMIKHRSKKRRKNQIIIISQPRSGVPISKFAVELSSRSDFDCNILYKLHPLEIPTWREQYPWLVDSDIEVLDSLETDLHKLLSESKMQLGVGSTAVFEGLAFGLRTFILDLPGSEYFDSFIQSGQATKVSTVDDLIASLSQDIIDRPRNTEFVLVKNGVRLTLDAIEGLLRKNS